MASAIQLTAAASIMNGKGLATSGNILAQIATLQSQTPISTLANMFANVTSFANSTVVSSLSTLLGNLGHGVSKGQWLIDFYPANVTAVSSGSVSLYLTANANTASFSNTLTNQAQLPFAYGMSGFANVYQTVYSYTNSAFDTISSVYLLQNKTYNQAGLGYTGPVDIATGGITGAQTLSNVIANWGTMYDINNINTIGNAYVFGQNLLNQGLGKYGNLSTNLSTAGLNLNNLLAVPRTTTTVVHQPTTHSVSTSLGAVVLPTIEPVVSSTVVTGNSPAVLLSIYGTVTGSALSSITTATRIQLPDTVTITSLQDFLNLETITDPITYAELVSLGITDFTTLGAYLQSVIGQGRFLTWDRLSQFLLSHEIPTLSYTATTGSSAVLSSNVITTLTSAYGTGAGPFGNPIISDYLGATSGMLYTTQLQTLNQNYSALSSSINLSTYVSTLNTAVNNYLSSNGSVGNTAVTSAVAGVNNALNSLTSTLALSQSSTAYYTMISKLSTEVANLNQAGVLFNSGNPNLLKTFGQNFEQVSTDKIRLETYQFFSNIISADSYGDTLRLAITEGINIQNFSSAGIRTTNNPNPALIVSQAIAQNIPLTTYISQNK